MGAIGVEAGPESHRLCVKCGESKPTDMFMPDRSNGGGRHGHCRACRRAYGIAWRAKNKDRVKETSKRARLKNRYGLTLEEFELMWADADGKCEVCRKQLVRGNSHALDHCHATGALRGLLCRSCNLALGYAADEPERLRALADYLELHRREPSCSS